LDLKTDPALFNAACLSNVDRHQPFAFTQATIDIGTGLRRWSLESSGDAPGYRLHGHQISCAAI